MVFENSTTPGQGVFAHALSVKKENAIGHSINY